MRLLLMLVDTLSDELRSISVEEAAAAARTVSSGTSMRNIYATGRQACSVRGGRTAIPGTQNGNEPV